MRILVVDDDPLVLRGIVRILGSDGHCVQSATGTAEALRAFEIDLPELLLTDVQMTPRDGFDLVRQVRRISPATACILMTGNPQVSIPGDLRDVPLLAKPLAYDRLEWALRQLPA